MSKKNNATTTSVVRNAFGYDVSKFVKIKSTVRRDSSTGKLTVSDSNSSHKKIVATAKAT